MPKILIVDDEPGVVELIKNSLEKNNYEVVTASDGLEGVEKAWSKNPDLIILDIMMPNMSGGDAVRALKSNSTTGNIPIIFLSAVVSKKEEMKNELSVKIENIYYPAMAKPFEPLVLLAKIEELLKSHVGELKAEIRNK